MENKIFQKLFSQIAQKYEFETAFGGWYKESNECLFVFDLMKSGFENYYQINIKIYINGVFKDRYIISKFYIKNAIGNINRGEPKEYEKALSLENELTDNEREKSLNEFFRDFLVPFAEKALRREGIKELEHAGEISIMPAVKTELEKLIKNPPPSS
jgi:hypothetical protein